jgi:hypothetical protein
MAVFNPELAAKMKMPKELLDEASSLHFVLHIGDGFVEAALFEASSGRCRWHIISNEFLGDPVEFVYQRNWHDHIFRKCTVSFDTEHYAVVPSAYFDEKQITAYLQLQHNLPVRNALFSEMTDLDAICCFDAPDWMPRLMSFIPNARIIPAAALLARYAAISANAEGFSIACWATNRQISMACLRQRKLQLLATHEVSAEEDAMYHIANASMRLGFELEQVQFELLVGQGMSELKPLLSKYVRQINENTSSDNQGSFMPQLHVLCA